MRLRRELVWIVMLTTIAVFVESSVLGKKSLLDLYGADSCFTCKASDRPLAWPLISYLNQLKDMLTTAFNKLTSHVKDFKLK